MYTSLLVPLDGSALAEAALPWAEMVARDAACPLYLVRAASPTDTTEAESYLARTAAEARARGLAVEAVVAQGPAIEILLWEAARRQADLIVLGTHGRSGPERWVLGSVADEVLHRTARPVLLVREGQVPRAGRPRRVLVPLDGSNLAERALEHARALAGPNGELLLYQVLAPATPIIEDAGPESFWSEVLEDARGEAESYLEGLALRLRAAGCAARTAAQFGVPSQRIAQYARAEDVDLIVLSSHGRSGAARWLLGSVADELVRAAPVPLLLLRPLLAEAPVLPVAPEARATPLAAPPAEPTTTLALSGRQVQIVRLALESLLWDARREEHMTGDIRALLDRLPANVPSH